MGEEAAHQGNTVHEMLACKFNNSIFIVTENNKDIVELFQHQVNYVYNKIIKILTPVYIEHVIFDPTNLISGTFDGLFITKDKTKYVLIDWKTSKVIEENTSYNKWGRYPYQYLPDCNLSHYSLQLAEYARILKTQGYLEHDIPIIKKIVHVTSEFSKSYHCTISR